MRPALRIGSDVRSETGDEREGSMRGRATAIGPDLSCERRRGGDRRRRPTPFLSRHTLFGRRRGGRRDGEDVNVYVDRYDALLLGAVVAILGLNVLDAYFTLLHLNRGGTELNPLVAELIDCGPLAMVSVKTAVTALCLAFLVMHQTFVFVRRIIGLVLVFYGLLLLYHLFLRLTP